MCPASAIHKHTWTRLSQRPARTSPLLKADLELHGPDIDALIKRNVAQARALGFEGVPNFLIGPFKANGFVDYEGFKSAIAQARALTAKN